jgi:hypothetical protein
MQVVHNNQVVAASNEILLIENPLLIKVLKISGVSVASFLCIASAYAAFKVGKLHFYAPVISPWGLTDFMFVSTISISSFWVSVKLLKSLCNNPKNNVQVHVDESIMGNSISSSESF